ncbi:hypothetical protein CFP56_011220 [Quercus suber]|uniref:Uncharacterized protein n=1 Tax=Quercus suber TaxID=58331 RepID=A0AAW0MCH6_QUESU
MHAIVRKNVFQKFSAILHEGGTFIISNFKLTVTNKGYRPISNDLNIISLLTTSVKECNEEIYTNSCIIGKLLLLDPLNNFHFDNGSTNIRNLQVLLP